MTDEKDFFFVPCYKCPAFKDGFYRGFEGYHDYSTSVSFIDGFNTGRKARRFIQLVERILNDEFDYVK